MERDEFKAQYLELVSLHRLTSTFENSVTKVGEAESLKFGPIPQLDDFRNIG